MDFGVRFSKQFAANASVFVILLATPNSYLMAQTAAKQIDCEVVVLRATTDVAKLVFPSEQIDSDGQTGVECVTKDTPSIKNNAVSTSTTMRYRQTVPAYLVEADRYQQILDLLGNSKGCSVSAVVKTTTSSDGTASGFSGKARTYCVSSNKYRAKFGTEVSVPEYQVVEDGIVVEHHVKTDAKGGLDIDSQIVINEVTEVNTFTFDGATRPITLELATSSARQLNIKANLAPDHVLIVASPYIDNTVEQPISKGPFLSNVPYVNRLFKNVGVGKDSCVLYYVISASN